MDGHPGIDLPGRDPRRGAAAPWCRRGHGAWKGPDVAERPCVESSKEAPARSRSTSVHLNKASHPDRIMMGPRSAYAQRFEADTPRAPCAGSPTAYRWFACDQDLHPRNPAMLMRSVHWRLACFVLSSPHIPTTAISFLTGIDARSGSGSELLKSCHHSRVIKRPISRKWTFGKLHEHCPRASRFDGPTANAEPSRQGARADRSAASQPTEPADSGHRFKVCASLAF